MSARAKRNFLRLFIIEIVTLIIVIVHFGITPAHRPYAIPFVIGIVAALVITAVAWIIMNKKAKEEKKD